MIYFKSFVCLVVAFCLCTVFISCSGNSNNLSDVFSQLAIHEGETDGETETPAFAEHIYVIIPNNCSGELSLKARELTDKIKEKTGLLTSLKYDNELTVAPKNSCEILIGSTNRLASANALDVLRKDEYLCHWDDGAIVICGRSDASTLTAIEKFIKEILPFSSEYSLMQNDMSFEFVCEYEVDSIVINGYDLYDYVLTYPESNKCGEKEIAFMIRDYINSQSGYFLDVISDGELTAKSGRVISLSGKGKANTLASVERGLSLVATDSYSLSLVAAQFLDDFEKNIKDGAVNLKYATPIDIEGVDTSFEAVFYYIKKNDKEPFRPIYNALNFLHNQYVGFCFIANPDDQLRQDFKLNIKNPIKLYEFLIGKRELMIAYNEEKVKQINISVDKNENYVEIDIETAFGEKICYIYIIKGDIPKLKRNTLIFYENPGEIEYDDLHCDANGNFNSSEREIGYLFAHSENLFIKNSDSVVDDNESSFSCLAKTDIVYSNALLDYTLK